MLYSDFEEVSMKCYFSINNRWKNGKCNSSSEEHHRNPKISRGYFFRPNTINFCQKIWILSPGPVHLRNTKYSLLDQNTDIQRKTREELKKSFFYFRTINNLLKPCMYADRKVWHRKWSWDKLTLIINSNRNLIATIQDIRRAER